MSVGGSHPTAMVEMAERLAASGEHGRALELLERALGLARELGDLVAVAQAVTARAHLLVALRRPSEALAVLAVYEDADLDALTEELAIGLLLERGNALSDVGRYDEAATTYWGASDLFDRRQDLDRAWLDMELEVLLSRMGRYAAAREHGEAALAAHLMANRHREAASARLNLGVTLKQLGETEGAIDCLRLAQQAFAELGEHERVADCDVNLANIRRDQHGWQDALALLAAAREVYVRIGRDTEVADCDDSRGTILHELGDLDEAERLQRSALVVYREAGLVLEDGICRMNLGHTLYHLGRHDESVVELGRSVAAFERMGAEDRIPHAQLLLVYPLAGAGRHADALELLETARRGFHRQEATATDAWCDLARGTVLRLAGREAGARPALESALAAMREGNERLGEAEAMLELAYVLGGDQDSHRRALLTLAAERFADLGLPNRRDEAEHLARRG